MTAISNRTYSKEEIIAIGGQEWSPRPSMCRVYINNAWELGGLEITRYRTGNVSGAWINGRRIANSRASVIAYALDKVWWDSCDNKIHAYLGRGSHVPELREVVEQMIDEIDRLVAEAVDADSGKSDDYD